MKHKTRILALFMALCLLVSLFPSAFAEGGDNTSENTADVTADTADYLSSEPESVEEEPAEEPAVSEDQPEEPAVSEDQPEEPAASEEEQPEEPAESEEEQPEEPAVSEEQPEEPAVSEEEQPEEPEEQEATVEADELSFSGSVPLTLAPSGDCGVGVHWRLDDNGLLTISGTGAMKDYTVADPAEWAKYEVLNAVIEHGVTKIGNNAFFCAGSKLKSVIIADTVVNIGSNAFKDCGNLTEITFMGEVPGAIEGTAFSGVTATAYYPFEADSWTATKRDSFGESFTWKAYDSLGKIFYAAGNCSTDLKWALSTEGVLTIAGTGTMDENPWIEFSSSIFSVVIDSDVLSIGVSAFDSCSGLTSVSIPDTVTIIEKSAFNGCSSLLSVSIPDTVTSIGDNAFGYCSSLKSITISDSVTSIGDYAFRNCSSLTEIDFMGNAPTIGPKAFFFVKANAKYPANDVTWTEAVRQDYGGTIAWVAYGICGEKLGWTLDNKGVLTVSGTGDMYDFPTVADVPWYSYTDLIKDVVIESGAASIGDHAFYGCSKLASVSIPQGVTRIGIYAFDGCSSLTSVSIPEGVTSIRDYTFRQCNKLASVSIPEGVTSIGNLAFSGCADLISVIIPESVTSIGSNAFDSCSSLASVIIPEAVTSIGEYAFSDCSKLASVSIPETVTVISNRTFSGCEALTSISIPKAVTSIGEYAFSGCKALTSITIPDSVENIGTAAFESCEGLMELTFKGSAPTIGANAFSGVTADAYYPAIDATWTDSVRQDYGGTIKWLAYYRCGEQLTWTLDSDGVLKISGTGAMDDYDKEKAPWYSKCDIISKVEIGDEVTSIGAWAFYNCKKLTSITIPDSVKSIGTGALCWCSSLPSVNIPNGVTSIADNTFESCTKLASIALPYTLKSIGNKAFELSGISGSQYLPESVTSIGTAAFSSCVKLENIIAAPNSKNFTSIDGVLFNKDMTVLLIYPAGKTAEGYEVPAGVKSIGDYAFAGCKNLKGVTIPAGVTKIGKAGFSETGLKSIKIPTGITSISDSTFYGCADLVSITFPKGVTSIGKAAFSKTGFVKFVIPDGITSLSEYTFYDCKSLKSVTIPKSVTSIGESCFGGCIKLTSVSIPKSVTSIGESCFSRCIKLTSITIPESVTSIGSKAFDNCSLLSEIIFKGSAPTIGENAFKQLTTTAYYPGSNSTWTADVRKDYGSTLINWKKASCDIKFEPSAEMSEGSSVWIDGIEYKLISEGGKLCVKLSDEKAKVVTIYTYNGGGTAHETYPTGMKVWLLSHDGKEYTANYVSDFDNLLGYAGSSIRISGTKGIRMITSIKKSLKDKLIGDGVEGCKLMEYGTLLAWESKVPASQLVLGASGVSSNYAYKRGVADPIFAYKGDVIQYTNVITGFTNDQCKPDLVMRPYMKLVDSDDNEIIIYGGAVQRSIGYIAYQNRSAFNSGTTAYEYVWEIIHHVYGNLYDKDYYGG